MAQDPGAQHLLSKAPAGQWPRLVMPVIVQTGKEGGLALQGSGSVWKHPSGGQMHSKLSPGLCAQGVDSGLGRGRGTLEERWQKGACPGPGILADTVLCRVGFSRRWEVALGVTGKSAELRCPLG